MALIVTDRYALAAALLRAEEQRDELLTAAKSARDWVEHWQQDVYGGLKPTMGSLHDALNELERAIAKVEPGQ